MNVFVKWCAWNRSPVDTVNSASSFNAKNHRGNFWFRKTSNDKVFPLCLKKVSWNSQICYSNFEWGTDDFLSARRTVWNFGLFFDKIRWHAQFWRYRDELGLKILVENPPFMRTCPIFRIKGGWYFSQGMKLTKHMWSENNHGNTK